MYGLRVISPLTINLKVMFNRQTEDFSTELKRVFNFLMDRVIVMFFVK